MTADRNEQESRQQLREELERIERELERLRAQLRAVDTVHGRQYREQAARLGRRVARLRKLLDRFERMEDSGWKVTDQLLGNEPEPGEEPGRKK